MSRFNSTRWNRIFAWTGAALAWGSALTATGLEPLRAQQETPEQPVLPVVVDHEQLASVPAQPERGLVILRYRQAETPSPEVRTVYVRRPTPTAAPMSSAQSSPAPSPAPAPRSSGS
jgi:hypothetical protein